MTVLPPRGVDRQSCRPQQRIDPQARKIGLADGGSVSYDRLVLAPGIDLRFRNGWPGL